MHLSHLIFVYHFSEGFFTWRDKASDSAKEKILRHNTHFQQHSMNDINSCDYTIIYLFIQNERGGYKQKLNVVKLKISKKDI